MQVAVASAPRTETGTDRIALVLFGLVLALLPIGRSAELPLVLAALLGVGVAWRSRATDARTPLLALAGALFLAYWIPMAVSALDAIAPQKAWLEVVADLRFLPFALLAVVALGAEATRLARLYGFAALVVAFWTLDALVQAATGWSLGGQLGGDRISGVFGDGNQKLGPILAVLSPFALEAVYRRRGRAWLVPAWAVLGAAILLAGARAGWIMYALVSLAYAWRSSATRRGFALALCVLLAGGVALAVSAYALSERFAARVDRTLALGAGSEPSVDHALAGRVPIFRTAIAMFAAHPVNGVGVRGFRYAYPTYAAPDDPWVDAARTRGASHPHHLVLEVLAETGIIGLACWLLGAWLAIRAYLAVPGRSRRLAFVPMLALAAMTFPLNTHFAFYSSYWGVLFWWLLAVYCAALRADSQQEPGA